MMPFHYTSEMSVEDAYQQAAWLGVRYRNLPIASIYDNFTSLLSAGIRRPSGGCDRAEFAGAYPGRIADVAVQQAGQFAAVYQ